MFFIELNKLDDLGVLRLEVSGFCEVGVNWMEGWILLNDEEVGGVFWKGGVGWWVFLLFFIELKRFELNDCEFIRWESREVWLVVDCILGIVLVRSEGGWFVGFVCCVWLMLDGVFFIVFKWLMLLVFVDLRLIKVEDLVVCRFGIDGVFLDNREFFFFSKGFFFRVFDNFLYLFVVMMLWFKLRKRDYFFGFYCFIKRINVNFLWYFDCF